MTENPDWPQQRQPSTGTPDPRAPMAAPTDPSGFPAPWASAPPGPYGYIPQQRGPETQQWEQAPGFPSGPVPGWPAPPGDPPRRTMTLILAVVAAVVLLLAGGGVAWFLWHRGSSHPAPAAVQAGTAATAVNPGRVPGGATAPPQTSAALPSPPSASRAPTPAPPPAPGSGAAETAALTTLNSLRASSLARVPLDGRWVAQVASKYVGVTDPLQVAQNGTHTFYAADILAESLSARSTVNDPTKVYLLVGTDFGQRSTGPSGAPLWTTIVDAGYASHDNVLAWCHVTYPSLTPDQLANACIPRQLTAPHD